MTDREQPTQMAAEMSTAPDEASDEVRGSRPPRGEAVAEVPQPAGQSTADATPAASLANAPAQGRGPGGVPSQAESDAHLVRLWLHGKSENTRSAYRRDVRQFVDLIDRPLRQVRLDDLQRWDEHLAERYATNTRRRKLATLKSLFSFGQKIGYFRFDVGAPVPVPKAPTNLAARILTEEEVQRVFALEPALRNRVMLRVYYVSGCRVSELAGLQWRQITERPAKKSAQIHVRGKGEETRNVLLSRGTWEALSEWQEEARAAGHSAPGDAVFWSQKGGALSRVQVWRIVKKAAARAGIDLSERPVSPHWLRHAHVSHALDRGAPPHLVRDTVGHASLETTTRYAHARPGESSGQYLGT